MKKIYYILTLLLCVYVQTANAQMGVNSTGALPATSAMLDVNSTTKGFLMPRMTTAQRTAIASPAVGLQVYDTSLNLTFIWNGTVWTVVNAWTTTGNNIYNSNIGNVGIGTLTPATKLDVSTSSSSNVAQFNGLSPMYMGIFEGGSYRGYWGSYTGSDEDVDFGTGGGNTTGKVHLTIQTVPKLTIASSGKVGIGTTVPNGRLHIEHDTQGDNQNPHIRLTQSSNSSFGRIRMENAAGSVYFQQRFNVGGGTAANNYVKWDYGTDELLMIRGDGRIGINVNNPSDLLHLSPISATGDVFARISTTTGLGGLRLQNSAGDWSLYSNEFSRLFLGYSTDNFATNNEILIFEPNGANYNVIPATSNQVFLGTSGNRWREIWSQNNLNTSSDRRLKKNINDIKYGLDEIMRLQAVTYNWKDNDDKRLQLGFIAQDVEKIVPEIVTKSGISDEEFERLEKKGEKVTDTYGMQYTGLIPVLVKAVQEQQKVIEDKTNRISQLEGKLQKMNDLEARLNLIEALMNSQKSEIRTSINDK
jgi:trimeric autotransporter adhesin